MILILTTLEKKEDSVSIGKELLKQRLIACYNLFPGDVVKIVSVPTTWERSEYYNQEGDLYWEVEFLGRERSEEWSLQLTTPMHPRKRQGNCLFENQVPARLQIQALLHLQQGQKYQK